MTLSYSDLVPIADDISNDFTDRLYPDYYCDVSINWDQTKNGVYAFDLSFSDRNGHPIRDEREVNGVQLNDQTMILSEKDIMHRYGELIMDLREDGPERYSY